MVVNIVVTYCCTRKMLKESEGTIGFFVTFLSLVAFQLNDPGPLAPLWLRLCCLLLVYKVL